MAAPITLSCFLVIALAFFTGLAECTTFTITNNCPYTVWPATLTGGDGQQLSSTGFELAQGASSSLTANAPWTGRIWGRTDCSTDSSGRFSCVTADCGSGQVSCNGAGGNPPATLVELTLNTSDQDFYDVSNVDGFNIPVSVAPQGGSGSCSSSSCPAGDLNSGCPSQLAVQGSDGTNVACRSACLALNEPQYCCTGDFGTAETCPPTTYSDYFKGKCPEAYSYAYDDKSSTFTCTAPPSYQITFCP